MKRLDLHPITYGIPRLQYTMNGRLASPRHSRGHSQIPHRMVQYVQNTVAESLLGRLWNFWLSDPLPLPPRAPASQKWSPVWDNTFWLFDSQVFELRLLPQRGGFYLYIYFLSLLTFWLKERKKENKHITVLKYCLTYSVSLCSVCAQDRAELILLLFCLGEGRGAHQCLSSMCLPASVPLPSPAPHFYLPWKVAWLVEAHWRKKILSAPHPYPPGTVSLCLCVPLPTDKEKYELVFLL